MTWYFNFCNYFLPSDPVINNNRMALFIMMGIQVLFYAFVRIIIVYYQGGEAFKQKLKLKNNPQNLEETVDKLSGDVEEKEEKGKSDNLSTDKDKSDESKSSDGNESGVHILKDGKRGYGDEPSRRLGKLGEMFSTMDFLTFQKTFGDFFGHHAVGVAMCYIFCPMYFVTLASLVYSVLGLICFFFHGFKYQKTSLGLYIVTVIINVCMLFTALVSVGLLNYDLENNSCYATQDFSQYNSRR